MDLEQIRKDFPILNRQVNGHRLVYLDNAATSQKPQVVINAITDYYQQHNANIHRGIHTLSDESTTMYESSRATISRFIGASDPNQLIFVRNTTEAVNLVAFSWAMQHLNEGDEILVTELEHHSNLVPWQRVCRQTGAKLVMLPVDGNGDLTVDYLKDLVSKRTKLVALTQVSNVLGTTIDIIHLVKDLKRAGAKAKILVDGAQSTPHMPIHIEDLNVDFFVFSGHKMLGPMGIGGLWVKKDILGELEPFLVGGGMIGDVSQSDSTWADLPDKFDAGTPNVAGAVGLAAACKYLKGIGMDTIHQHEQDLLTYGLAQMTILEKQGIVDQYGSRDLASRAAILTFNVAGAHAHDTAQILDRDFGIAVRSGHHCNQLLTEKLGVPATVRASLYLYNTKAEIDLLVEALRHVKNKFS